MLGKSVSWAPTIKEVNQFPKPLIIKGIIMKKMIIKAWDIVIVL